MKSELLNVSPDRADAPKTDEREAARPRLPVVDSLFVEDEVPEDVVQAIAAQLQPPEAIFVLLQLHSPYHFTSQASSSETAPIWTIVTGARLLLLAISSDGQIYCDSFDQHTVIEYQDGLARDEVKIADKTLLTGIWEGKRKLFKSAVHLFPMPEYEKYLHLAQAYLEQDAYAQARPFLEQSLKLEPTITAHVLLVYALSGLGMPDKAIEVVQQTYQLAEPAAVLEELRRLFPDNLIMFLYLAAVCEKNHWWDAAIEVYQTLLQKTPDFDLYLLKLGEMYNWKHQYQQALDYYQQFIRLRTTSERFRNGDFLIWDLTDPIYFGTDPDLIRAFFDVGRMYEEALHELEQARSAYWTLLRHAPFYPQAYHHGWRLHQPLLARQGDAAAPPPDPHLTTLWQAFKILDVSGAAAATQSKPLSSEDAEEHETGFQPSIGRPVDYHPLDETDREVLTHPGEQEYWSRIQQWLTGLVLPEDDDESIADYCEQVSTLNYPQLAQMVTQVAGLLGIAPPRCFISRGKTGVSVKNREAPFLFIGSEHLNEQHDCYLSETEWLFTLASQMEHIRAGHLLITGTDLWKSLGTASFDGFLVALQCLPAGSFLSRLTHRFATESLKKMYKMTRYTRVQNVFKFVERLTDPARANAPAEDADEAQAAEKQADKRPQAESLLKEQIVDFARHAVYTADRVGLLACNDLEAACTAIFKLAGNPYDEVVEIQKQGLLHILKQRDKRGSFLYFEYAKRFHELLKFALSEDYWRLHAKVVVVPGNQPAQPNGEAQQAAAYDSLLTKLRLLIQSHQQKLLNAEELVSKQTMLFQECAWLRPEDRDRLTKVQQAYQTGVLTAEELHARIVHTLDAARSPQKAQSGYDADVSR